MALHEVGSNNPDGVEIKKHKDAQGRPLDGIPFHPYYTVKDMVGVVVFLFLFFMVVFFAPEMGGYFLEFNNFIPADPLKTPPHIAPVWYFTPYYSILRAITEDFMLVLAIGVAAYVVLIWLTARNQRVKFAASVIGLALIVLMKGGPLAIEAKVWGVVMMGAATLIFFLMPWLDRSPVKSIRYKGPLFKAALTSFVIVFLVLGYYGTQTVTPAGTIISQVGTLIYFSFFLLMPWYSAIDKTKPEPDRVTMR